MDVALLLLVISAISTQAQSQGGTCKACNCQFDNIQALDQLIDLKIATKLATQTGLTGVTYTRWGRTSCPSSTGAELIYSGRAGGTDFESQGGTVEKVCLPEDPDYTDDTAGVLWTSSVIHGAEYELFAGPNDHVFNHNVPCAVCYVPTRSTTITIPAKNVCPPSWTREYYGYLTAEAHDHYRSSLNCLDADPDVIGGGVNDTNGALFYYVSAECTTLSCPPYQQHRILSCAVCTK